MLKYKRVIVNVLITTYLIEYYLNATHSIASDIITTEPIPPYYIYTIIIIAIYHLFLTVKNIPTYIYKL